MKLCYWFRLPPSLGLDGSFARHGTPTQLEDPSCVGTCTDRVCFTKAVSRSEMRAVSHSIDGSLATQMFQTALPYLFYFDSMVLCWSEDGYFADTSPF